jgi:hypothetical protein
MERDRGCSEEYPKNWESSAQDRKRLFVRVTGLFLQLLR